MEFELHDKQLEVFSDDHRFKVVVAGRRGGKTYLAQILLLTEGLQTERNGRDLSQLVVGYFAPTQQLARDLMFVPLKYQLTKLFGSEIRTRENEGIIFLPNGREIHLRGADNPKSPKGKGYSFVVMDEYADMKPQVWEEAIRPALMDAPDSKALFIGTPDGQGGKHFEDLFWSAAHPLNHDWAAFRFTSRDNPFINQADVENAAGDMSEEVYRQEILADFQAFGGQLFKRSDIQIRETPIADHDVYMAVDLSGFDPRKKIRGKSMDNTAIAIVEVGVEGWRVLDIIADRWDTRGTAIRILRAAQKHHPVAVGIEKGMQKAAVMPYLDDNMRRLGVFPTICDVSHKRESKQNRIQWALQGRIQAGRLFFAPGAYLEPTIEELLRFPAPNAHDDRIDALAFVDQLAKVGYGEDEDYSYDPLDQVTGF